MKKILVTGGSGFIGTNLVKFLIKKKFFVFNIDKISKISTPERFKGKSNSYYFKKLNLKDNKKLNQILVKYKFDFILHLAAESHVDRSIDKPKKFFFENINSTFNLYNEINNCVKLKKIHSPKILHISTDEVYGSIKSGFSSEESSIFTSSPYSSSKAASENIAQSYMKTFNLNICILRITNNYGPFQFPEKFIPKSILKIFSNKKIPLYSKGENVREWIHVDDTCEAIYKTINNFKGHQIFNIGSEERLKNIEVLNIIINELNYSKKNIKFVNDRPGHDFRYALNSRKFKKVYKWKPKIKFKNGIRRTIKWYKNNNKWLSYINTKYNDVRLGKK